MVKEKVKKEGMSDKQVKAFAEKFYKKYGKAMSILAWK